MSTATVSAPRPPRVVADSNVFISALLGSAQAAAVLTLAQQATIALYASDYIFTEVAKVLEDKFSWAPSRIADALQGVRGYVRLVSPGRRRITVVRDPKDNPILECARAARAKYLVTGDRDLLVLRSYGRLRILTIRDFLILYPSTSET